MNGFKPCPFCGNKKIAVESKEVFDATRTDFADKYDMNILTSSCECCNLVMHEYVSFETDYAEAVEIIKKKWNTREVSE